MQDSPRSSYYEIHKRLQEVLDETFPQNQAVFGRILELEVDLQTFTELIERPHSIQLQIALKELAVAGYCAATGLYRQAYSGLRLFLELSFASVYFSVNEVERRSWHAGDFKYSWSSGLEANNGLLSEKFVNLFQPELSKSSGTYSGRALSAYRICSEYIHGRAQYSEKLPLDLQYSEQSLNDWADNSIFAMEAVLFLLLVRYFEQFSNNERVIDIIQNRFGHEMGFRKIIGLAKDG